MESATKEKQILGYIEQYKPLIHYFARKLKAKCFGIEEDLVSVGNYAIITAIDKIDENKNTDAYLKQRIYGEMVDYIRSVSYMPRFFIQFKKTIEKFQSDFFKENKRNPFESEILEGLKIENDEWENYKYLRNFKFVDINNDSENFKSLEEFASYSPFEDFIEGMDRSKLKDLLLKIIYLLPEKERIVITLKIFADWDFDKIGEYYQYSGCGIRLIYISALNMIKNSVNYKVLKEFC